MKKKIDREQIPEGDRLACANRAYIGAITALLQNYFHYFPEETERLHILRRQLAERDGYLCSRKNMVGHLTASGLLWNAEDRTILLIYHNFLQTWLQPGGHLEFEEQPAAGAIREMTEETGLAGVRLHDWHTLNPIPIDVDTHFIPANTSKREGEHHHHDFQYILKATPATMKLQTDEVSQYRWVPVEEFKRGEFDERLRRSVLKLETHVAEKRSANPLMLLDSSYVGDK